MNREKVKFEFSLELLALVKQENCDEFTLMKRTNLSKGALHLVLDPLLSRGLLKRARGSVFYYQLTEKGDQFIDLLGLCLKRSDSNKQVADSRWTPSYPNIV